MSGKLRGTLRVILRGRFLRPFRSKAEDLLWRIGLGMGTIGGYRRIVLVVDGRVAVDVKGKNLTDDDIITIIIAQTNCDVEQARMLVWLAGTGSTAVH